MLITCINTGWNIEMKIQCKLPNKISCSNVYTHTLQLAQNTAARVVARIPRHHHITPTLQHLKWLPINKRCQFKILVVTFKALHSQVPSYMCD